MRLRAQLGRVGEGWNKEGRNAPRSSYSYPRCWRARGRVLPRYSAAWQPCAGAGLRWLVRSADRRQRISSGGTSGGLEDLSQGLNLYVELEGKFLRKNPEELLLLIFREEQCTHTRVCSIYGVGCVWSLSFGRGRRATPLPPKGCLRHTDIRLPRHPSSGVSSTAISGHAGDGSPDVPRGERPRTKKGGVSWRGADRNHWGRPRAVACSVGRQCLRCVFRGLALSVRRRVSRGGAQIDEAAGNVGRERVEHFATASRAGSVSCSSRGGPNQPMGR